MTVGFRCQNKSKEETTQWMLVRIQNGKITINLRIQESGKYALDLFGKPFGTDGSFPNLCTYLVCSANGVFDKLVFPPISNQDIGPTGKNRE